MNRLVLLVASVLLVSPLSSAFADEEQDARKVKVAQAFIEGVKQGKGRDALEECWSFEEVCQRIFSNDQTKLSEKDQARCVEAVRDAFVPLVASPEMEAALADATCEDFETKGRSTVKFTVTPARQDSQPYSVSLYVTEVGDAYRIYNFLKRKGGEPICNEFNREWRATPKETTPLDFARMLRSRMLAKKPVDSLFESGEPAKPKPKSGVDEPVSFSSTDQRRLEAYTRYSKLTVEFPPGALSGKQKVVALAIPATRLDRFLGGSYTLGPKDLKLTKPARITIRLFEAAFEKHRRDVSQAELTLARYDVETLRYVVMDSVYDKRTQTVSGTIPRLYGDGIVVLRKK